MWELSTESRSWYICTRTRSYSWGKKDKNHHKFALQSKICYYCNITFFHRSMKSYTDTQKNTLKTRIKWPYSEKETELLRSYIFAWLLVLRDTGKWVNYEEFCESIATWIPESIIAPEFIAYWRNWGEKFRQHKVIWRTRKNIFEEWIQDLRSKWLLPTNIIWLTGNFSNRIQDIFTKNPTL